MTSADAVVAEGRRSAEEAQLMGRVAQGDGGEPLRELYRRYERPLYGVGLGVLRDPSLAEEMVQETFVRLWRMAGRFDPDRGTVRAFVFTIARRVAVDLLRRPSSRPFAEARDEDAASAAEVEAVLAGVTVREALTALTPDHRQVVELLYGQDLRQADVAERLGVPLGTVKTRSFHALRALRRALEERDWHG